VIFPAALLFYLAWGLASFGIIFYARDVLQASAGQIGWLVAAPQLAYLAGCLLFPPLFGLLLPWHYLAVATGGAAVLFAGLLVVANLRLVFLLFGLSGFLIALFWPPLMGWLARGLEEQALGRTLRSFNLTWSTSNILSPYAAGLLLERGRALPLWTAAALTALTCLYVSGASLAMPGVRADREREPAGRRRLDAPDHSTRLRYPAWIGLVASYVLTGVLVSIFPLYLRDTLGFSESRVGLLLLVRALCVTAAFWVLGRRSFWHFRRLPMVLGQIALAASSLALILFRSFLPLALMLVPIGLLAALSYNESLFHGVSGSPRRAARMAIHEACLTVGFVLGASGGGLLLQHGSFSRALAFIAAAILLAAAAQALLAWRLPEGRRR
jgi:MFS family permease